MKVKEAIKVLDRMHPEEEVYLDFGLYYPKRRAFDYGPGYVGISKPHWVPVSNPNEINCKLYAH